MHVVQMYIHVHVDFCTIYGVDRAFFGIYFFWAYFYIQKAQISCAADQHLHFSYMNSTIPLLPESHSFFSL